MIRQFYLTNESGASYDLTSAGKSLLASVSGLGFNAESTFIRIGSYHVETKREYAQAIFSGTLVLADYDEYKTFADFCLKSKEIRLFYTYPGMTGTAYSREIVVQNVSKGELTESFLLQCEISMAAKDPWTRSTTLTGASGDTVEYANDHQVESPWRLVLTASNEVDAVTVSMTDTEDAPLASMTVDHTASGTLVIDTRDGRATCAWNGTDAARYLNPLDENFSKIPKGETVNITVTGGDFTLTVYEEEVSV